MVRSLQRLGAVRAVQARQRACWSSTSSCLPIDAAMLLRDAATGYVRHPTRDDGFGLDNLPYGAVARPGGPAQLAVRIGTRRCCWPCRAGVPARRRRCNPLLALGRPAWDELREIGARGSRNAAPRRCR